MRQIEAHEKFLHADAAVDQVNLEIAAAQYAVAIFQLLRGNNLSCVTGLAEKLAEKRVLALPVRRKRAAEFQNRDVRLLGAGELLVRFQQRRQKVLLAADPCQRIAFAEFLYRRAVIE